MASTAASTVRRRGKPPNCAATVSISSAARVDAPARQLCIGRIGPVGGDEQTDAWISNGEKGATLLWTARNDVRCVVKRYDETRYQLRLLRGDGTIKADLFSNHAEAVCASHVWRQQLDVSRSI